MLRPNAPRQLAEFQESYHKELAKYKVNPIDVSFTFACRNKSTDFFIFGVDSSQHLIEVLQAEMLEPGILEVILDNIPRVCPLVLDPRTWGTV